MRVAEFLWSVVGFSDFDFSIASSYFSWRSIVVKRFYQFFCLAIVALSVSTAHAQFLQPLSSFGGGDGWLAPGEPGFFNPGANNARGLAYHSPSNRLIVVDRTGGVFVRLLDGDTGVEVGTLNSTGVSGGTFAANMVGVADDGHVYMGNLSTSNTSNFKIYRWDSSEVANPTSAPTLAYDATTGRVRTGDSFAVTGSGVNTRIASAGGSTANQHFAHFTTGNGTTFASTNPGVAGVPAGAFRLGIDFDDAGNVIGKQTGTATYQVSEVGGAATTFNVTDANESVVAFYAPLSLLATVQTGPVPIPSGTNPGDLGVVNTVRLYDASNINSLILLDAKNLTNVAVANANGVGSLSFGLGPDGGLRLYAMNTNNGIQAFSVVPEPSTGILALMAGLGLVVRRRRS